MKLTIRILFLAQLLTAAYGLYSEFAPSKYSPALRLPSGMGLSIALVAATMATTLLVVDRERQERELARQGREVWESLAGRISISLPLHEREFYSLWSAQVAMAQNNIDVTHLGLKPPRNSHGKEETKYFADLRRLYKDSNAKIRRVERATLAKREWIRKLVEDFRGIKNFSLRVYKDPSEDEMPSALSVCRIDDRYAWIVALAEHESTANVRDLMVTGRDAVELVRQYFHERLWSKSRPVIEDGTVQDGWEQELGW